MALRFDNFFDKALTSDFASTVKDSLFSAVQNVGTTATTVANVDDIKLGPPHGEANGNPNVLRADLDDASGTMTFVTDFGSVPFTWSADAKAQAFRTGDRMTLALTGEVLLTSPDGQTTFEITPSDLLRLRDGAGDTGLTLETIKEAAAPLIAYLAERGIVVQGASLDGEVINFDLDVSQSAALQPGIPLEEAFTNSTVNLSVLAQVMQNIALKTVTEGEIDLGPNSPIGQHLQQIIIDGEGTTHVGPITVEADGAATFDTATTTTTVNSDIKIIEDKDASLPGWTVTLGGGDDVLGVSVELADDTQIVHTSAERILDLGAGNNTLYLDGDLGMTILADKGDNWIQFTEEVSNLKDVSSEAGVLGSAMRVVDFNTGDNLAFSSRGEGATPGELTGDVLTGAHVDVAVDANATLMAKLETASANVEVDSWTSFQHNGDTFVFVQNDDMALQAGDGLIQLVGYTGELNNINFVVPAA
ncbi:hypothetical protein GSY71_12555 [Pusillimonas sp. TS35]|uniref:hypothetical protein n=1 Tax=Paracandidimonas lactea TaxID=2895524 RepID=UPI00136F14AD|nr:hypothetical protein [Paracandidimonas lactea]MYN13969.1 hypothetical protein [Pusillimonas sp. TS35]